MTIGVSAMPLQNRVTPTGDIVATPHRGLFTGNRGIIHDPATKTLTRRWASQAWLTCVCEFRGRRREVMGGRSWTELFFLDEATALAAGHRPCFYCRRDDANRFRAAWEERQWRCERSGARHRCGAAPRAARPSQQAAASHCRCRCDNCPTARCCRRAREIYLIAQGRALLWSLGRLSPSRRRARRRAAADAALDAARAGGGIPAGAASERGGN